MIVVIEGDMRASKLVYLDVTIDSTLSIRIGQVARSDIMVDHPGRATVSSITKSISTIVEIADMRYVSNTEG
jgi:hypothetical protein